MLSFSQENVLTITQAPARRRFLRNLTTAAMASTVNFAPQVRAAETESGQTVKLAEYAAQLHYDQIPAEVLQWDPWAQRWHAANS